MKTRIVVLVVLALITAVPAQADKIVGRFVQVADDAIGNPLVLLGPFDVWQLQLTSDVDVFGLEMAFNGDGEFLNALDKSVINADELVDGVPQLLSYNAPETAFVVPPGVAVVSSIFADDANSLRGAYAVNASVLNVPLVPGNGTPTPVAVFGVSGDSQLAFNSSLLGEGQFIAVKIPGFDQVPITIIPEPSTLPLVIVALLALPRRIRGSVTL